MKMPAEKEEKLDLFITSNSLPQYHGAFSHRQSCLLGLPLSINWSNNDDFDRQKDLVTKKSFPWEHPRADVVKAAFLLTDSEKEFLIARQLGYLDSHHVWMKLGTQTLCMVTAFMLAHVLNHKMGVFRGEHRPGSRRAVSSKKPAILASFIYFAFSVVGFAVYTLMSDSYNCYLDKHADKYAATLGPDFSLAGITYYNKILESNKALRAIVPGAEQMFTPYGNVSCGVIRVKTTPLMSRRDYMQRLQDKQLAVVKVAHSEEESAV